MELTLQRCLIHPDREAAARCPECGNCFCRECITEHEGRFLCSNCLQKKSASIESDQRTADWIKATLGMIVGLAIAWSFFYLIARL